MSGYDVIVVGGGAIGAATTYYLATSGAKPLLLERGRLGREASGRNAGTFNLLNDRIRDEWPLNLLKQTLEQWRHLSEELQYDLEVNVDKGTILVADTEAEIARLQGLEEIYARCGIKLDMLDQGDIRRIAPYISPEIPAAIYCPLGGLANPRHASWAFANAAQRHGAVVQEMAEVLDIRRDGSGWTVETTQGTYSGARVVLANGPWAKPMAARWGVDLPLRIRYFQVSATNRVARFIHHGIRRVAGMLTLKQNAQGNCILGGGWQGISAFPEHGHVDMTTVAQNCAVASKVVPGFARTQLLRTWAGYDGSSIDEQPIMDEVPGQEGLFISTGSSGGFTHAPVFGRITAEMLMGQSARNDMSRFRLARFVA